MHPRPGGPPPRATKISATEIRLREMSELAVVILAHSDAEHVRRLITALPDVRVFLHCDAKAPESIRHAMVDGLPSRVTLCQARSASLASWSLVEPELAALRSALSSTTAQHIAVCSGADYPLVSVEQLNRTLGELRGTSLFWNTPVPFAPWGTPRNDDGGMWRFNHRFITRNNDVVYVRGVPLRWPVKRQIPEGLDLRASSQWKIYARHHAELLLRIHDENPNLVDFWRTSLVPEESFAASVLGSRALAGNDALAPSDLTAWYIHWPDKNAHHPSWLTDAHFTALARAAGGGPPLTTSLRDGANGSLNDATEGTAVSPNRPQRALFARKFSTRIDTIVLDRIDAELRA